MTRLYFTRDCYYKNPAIPLYSAGHVYDIEDNMVMRWMKRGAIDIVKGGPGFGQASSKPNDQTGLAPIKPKPIKAIAEELPPVPETPAYEPVPISVPTEEPKEEKKQFPKKNR